MSDTNKDLIPKHYNRDMTAKQKQIYEKFLEYKTANKAVSMAALAKELSVNVETVKKALNHPKVKELEKQQKEERVEATSIMSQHIKMVKVLSKKMTSVIERLDETSDNPEAQRVLAQIYREYINAAKILNESGILEHDKVDRAHAETIDYLVTNIERIYYLGYQYKGNPRHINLILDDFRLTGFFTDPKMLIEQEKEKERRAKLTPSTRDYTRFDLNPVDYETGRLPPNDIQPPPERLVKQEYREIKAKARNNEWDMPDKVIDITPEA